MPSCYLTCPAYAVADAQQGRSAVTRAEGICSELGYELVVSPLLERHPGHGCWLEPGLRLADWDRAEEHDAIWAFRGGYGAIELALALVERGRRSPPRLIGYSDITALHLLDVRGEGIYGPVAGQPIDARCRASLIAAWRAGDDLRLGAAELPEVHPLRDGAARGPLLAACLRILAASVGTPLQPDLRGVILVVEDVSERPYAVDRDLRQLAAAGALDGLAGLIGNSFPHTRPERYDGPDHAAILRHWARELGVPAVIGLPCGHDRDPISLIQGRPAELRVEGEDWSLVQSASS